MGHNCSYPPRKKILKISVVPRVACVLPRCLSHLVSQWGTLFACMSAEPFCTMPPKQSASERDAQRARIWAAHTQGKGYAAIAAAEKLSKSTVQSIVKAIRQSGQVALRRAGGRPPTLTQRCDLHAF